MTWDEEMLSIIILFHEGGFDFPSLFSSITSLIKYKQE